MFQSQEIYKKCKGYYTAGCALNYFNARRTNRQTAECIKMVSRALFLLYHKSVNDVCIVIFDWKGTNDGTFHQ